MAHEHRQDNQSPALFGQTPWQTVGPFFHYGLPWKGAADLVGQSDLGARADLFPQTHYLLESPRPRAASGEIIELCGTVSDGAGAPVPDAMLEIWQADAHGNYAAGADGAFPGFGRAATLEDGSYRFRTIRPGAVSGPGNSWQAPHIAIGVFARGLLKRLVTRAYFAASPENAHDPILARVPEGRRSTLMARAEGAVWRFDIVLQGTGETVFFDI
jgi:protocatechuate 3,4-dioxygenase alpha subunit